MTKKNPLPTQLFVPRKDTSKLSTTGYGTDMRHVETWAKRFQNYTHTKITKIQKTTITKIKATITAIKATLVTINSEISTLTGKLNRLGNSASAVNNTGYTAHTGSNFVTAPGPAVTITTGTKVLITITAAVATAGVTIGYMGYACSGATTIGATTNGAAAFRGLGAYTGIATVAFSAVINVNPGSNTFTAAYRGGAAGTSTVAIFSVRHLTVVCLN
jgi:hypothetical protein